MGWMPLLPVHFCNRCTKGRSRLTVLGKVLNLRSIAAPKSVVLAGDMKWSRKFGQVAKGSKSNDGTLPMLLGAMND